MRHILLDKNWEYSEEPFPAYRCNLVFGRNKRQFRFLPVKDVNPIEGKLKDDRRKRHNNLVLPDHQFRIIKTKEKGTILVVPSNSEKPDDRCLAMIGASDGFRGGSGVLEEDTTASILIKCSAHNACEGRTSIVSIFEPGQKVILYSHGRRTNVIHIFEWTGEHLVETGMSRSEWNSCKICPTEDETEEL